MPDIHYSFPSAPKEEQDFIEIIQALAKASVITLPAYDSACVDNLSGNINRVRRVSFYDANRQQLASWIVKAVPDGGVLERYPEISFPSDRLAFEMKYYQTAHHAAELSLQLKRWLPQLIFYDASRSLMVMEDLAPRQTLESDLRIAEQAMVWQSLVEQLAHFHLMSRQLGDSCFAEKNPSFVANLPYVFSLPLAEPLQMQAIWQGQKTFEETKKLQQDFFARYPIDALLEKASIRQSDIFNASFPVLLHGDLHLGSIFIGAETPTVIDAELCQWGAGWYDLGVLLAHQQMILKGRVPFSSLINDYTRILQTNIDGEFVIKVQQMMGFEMIRRIIGAANACYLQDVSCKSTLLKQAVELILHPKYEVSDEG